MRRRTFAVGTANMNGFKFVFWMIKLLGEFKRLA